MLDIGVLKVIADIGVLGAVALCLDTGVVVSNELVVFDCLIGVRLLFGVTEVNTECIPDKQVTLVVERLESFNCNMPSEQLMLVQGFILTATS